MLCGKVRVHATPRVNHINSRLAMGKEISEEERDKKSWDSNAITPGTPFMAFLATALRYWVAQKLNTDPGWKNVSLRYLLSMTLSHHL